MKNPEWYYAVVAGRASGVYIDGEEAGAHVLRIRGGKMMNFRSSREAFAYLRRHGVPSPPPPSPPPSVPSRCSPPVGSPPFYVVSGSFYGICSSMETALRRSKTREDIHACSTFAVAEKLLGSRGFFVDPDGRMDPDGHWTWAAYCPHPAGPTVPEGVGRPALTAFCGGSVINNGAYNSIAAYATIFPQHREWDVVRNVSGPFVTSNRVEYLAALEAIKRANLEDGAGKKALVIFTDSELLVKSMTKWVFQWMHNGWVTSKGAPVKNRDLLQLLLEKRGNFRDVHFAHVQAHTGGHDWRSRWNEAAGRSARNATWAAAQNAATSACRPCFCKILENAGADGVRQNNRSFRAGQPCRCGVMEGDDAAAA